MQQWQLSGNAPEIYADHLVPAIFAPRVLLMWRGMRHSPGFAALADALDAAVGPEAATVMRAPFGLGDDPQPLAALQRDAAEDPIAFPIEAHLARASVPR